MMNSGFLIKEKVLSIQECDELTDDLAQGRPTGMRAGMRHLMTNPRVAALVSDERLLQIARLALGDSAIPFKATLFDKSNRANWLVAWHQDTALPIETRFASGDWGPWSEKCGINYAIAPKWALDRIVALRIHLDPSTWANGPLRVIEGSHRNGVLQSDQVSKAAQEGNCVECLVQRGGVLAMRPLLIHSSSKGTSGDPRRVLHIEYTDALELRENIRLAIA